MFVQSPSSTWISHLSDEKTRHNLSASKTLACLAMKSWFQWDLRSEAFGNPTWKLGNPQPAVRKLGKKLLMLHLHSDSRKRENAAQRLWYSSRPWPQHRPSTSAMPSLRCNASHNEKLPETRGEHFAVRHLMFVHLSSAVEARVATVWVASWWKSSLEMQGIQAGNPNQQPVSKGSPFVWVEWVKDQSGWSLVCLLLKLLRSFYVISTFCCWF